MTLVAPYHWVPMELLRYLDFELQVDAAREDGLHPVTVLRSPAGEGSALLDPSALPDAARLSSPPETLQQAREIGGALYAALFRDEVGALFEGSRQRALAQQAGLRLRLRTEDDSISALPWELLFDERGDQFLALSQETPLVRYLPVGAPVGALAIEPPLRILGLVAGPSDLPPVNVEGEKARLNDAVRGMGRGRRVEVTWVEGQTWRALQSAMLNGPWHIVHFVGHGRVNPESGASELLLADDQGLAAALGAEEFGSLLEDHRSLRLVVLNACEGARSDEGRPFASVAASLVRSGLPAVVAMQYEVTTEAAGELTRTFYGALAEGLPVDAALAEARKAMRLAVPTSVEWATPVLFLRSPDGVLFAPQIALVNLRRALALGAAGVLAVVALWAVVYWVVLPTWFPTQMSETAFGIAVAGIGTLDENGRMGRSALGDNLSEVIYRQLADELQAAQGEGLGDWAEVWHDSLGRSVKNVRLGWIEGATESERRDSAAALADRIGAEMVIYGYLRDPEGGEDLQLEFYHATPVREGEPSAIAGNLQFGAPIENRVPSAADAEDALGNLRGPAARRAEILYYIAQGIVYQLRNDPATALAVLNQAYENLRVLPFKDVQDGLALLNLFRGSAALYLRDYNTALEALDMALAIQPGYVNALMTKGNVYLDRAQIFSVKDTPLSDEERACVGPGTFAQAPADQAAALADAREAVRLLEEARTLAPDSGWNEGETFVALNLGLAYRTLGQALLIEQNYDEAARRLGSAEESFRWVLAQLSPDRQPQYVGWTQAGLGSTLRLQAYLALVEGFEARTVEDVESANVSREQEIALLRAAIGAFDACLDQREATAGRPLFLQRVLECSCTPYQREAVQALATVEASPPFTIEASPSSTIEAQSAGSSDLP